MVNPWFILAGVAVGIPVVFHWLKRKQVVPKPWGAFRLLLEVEARARRSQVERWLLLALRMAVIALLVLAFARPTARQNLIGGRANRAKHVAVILDNSTSMGRRLNDATTFELAQRRLLRDLDQLQMDRGTLLLMSDRPYQPFAGLTTQRAALQQAVEEAELSSGGTDPIASLRRAVRLLDEDQSAQSVVLLYHDFRQTGWDRERLSALNSEIKGRDVQLSLIHLEADEAQYDNQAVADLTWSSDIVSPGTELSLLVRLENFHSQPRERSLVLELDGYQVHEQLVTIPAAEQGQQGKAVVRLPIVIDRQGPHFGKLKLSADAVEFDNVRYFALEAVPQLKVLIADGAPQLNAAQSASYFAQQLLDTDVAGNILPTVLPVWDLPSAEFAAYDVVVLANIGRLNGEKFSELRDYVQQGGGVVYFLGDQVEPNDFRRAYALGRSSSPAAVDSAAAASAAQTLIDTGRVDRIQIFEGFFPGYPTQLQTGEFRIDPASVNFEHPLTHRFRQADLAAARIQTFFEFSEVDATTVPVRLDSGHPLVVERAFGAGRVLVFTSCCSSAWNDMLLTPSTAPLLLQSIYHCCGATRVAELNGTVGRAVEIPFPFDCVDRRVRLTAPDSQSHHVITRATELGRAVATATDLRHPGIYGFELEPERKLQPAEQVNRNGEAELRRHRGYFAVNADAAESDPRSISPQEVADSLDQAQVSLRVDPLLASRSIASDAWLWLMLTSVLVVCGECWLANRNL